MLYEAEDCQWMDNQIKGMTTEELYKKQQQTEDLVKMKLDKLQETR